MKKCCDDMWSEQLHVPLASLSPHSLTNNPSAGAVFGPHSGARPQLSSEHHQSHTGHGEVFG